MSFLSVGDVIKLYEIAERVYKNCRDCSGEYKALTVETRSLSNLLEDIQDKYDKIPGNRQQQLLDAYEPCIEVLEELDKLLLRYNKLDTRSKRTWDRITYDPDRTRTMRERLTASVTMLNSFYTSLVHDNQYLILEALERLEKDYRGGHREESIASIEQLASGTREDEDQIDGQAWAQILRDLEDVGISQQQALGYRDVIVDWLILAVNEGRLLEERSEHDTTSPMSLGLEASPRESGLHRTSHTLDMPANDLPMETYSSAPLLGPPSIPSPTPPQHPVHSVPSIDAQSQYTTSTPKTPEEDDSEDLSLYAEPPPLRLATPPRGPATHVLGPQPVPPTSTVPQIVPRNSPNKISPVPETTPPQAPPVILQSVLDPLRPFDELDKAITIDLEWTAHQVVEAWARNDFVAAQRHLEQQLAAVEHGQTCKSGTQPDRRILRHLLGVCASLTGKFTEAKPLFESVFNGIFLHHGNLDDGDIAAARWLGDVCLHTQEYEDAMLAFSVAYEGSINRFGVTHDRTQRVAAEIKLLDSWEGSFGHIERSLNLNQDPTTIFRSTNVKEKGSLMSSVKSRLFRTANSTRYNPGPPTQGELQVKIAPRDRYELKVPEGFLLAPLVSISTWPLPWDPFFRPLDTIQLERHMGPARLASSVETPLCQRSLRRNSLGDSKKLHFTTKRGGRWLINAVEQGLKEMGIEHTEQHHEPSIMCCLHQQRDGISFSEGVEIRFSKLPFRGVHGIKVTNVKYATRGVGLPFRYQDTADFRAIVIGILERAEADAKNVL